MNLYHKLCFFLLVGISANTLLGQKGTMDRDEYFRRMEVRALELSKRMAELAGTEPVQIIQPSTEPVYQLDAQKAEVAPPPVPSVQQSYDALPGPEITKPAKTESVKYEDKIDAPPLILQQTTEELKGSYFLRPIFVIQAPFDSEVKGLDTLDGEMGSGVGVVVGRRIENWSMSARFGYTHQEFSNPDFKGLGLGIETSGDVESLSMTANLGLTVPMTKKLHFEAGLGLGYSSVSHSLHIPGISLDVSKDSGFTYELSLLLDYSFSDRLSAFLGYRLAGIPEDSDNSNTQFDSVNAHLFELGLGLNF